MCRPRVTGFGRFIMYFGGSERRDGIFMGRA
jgi:hypothetical protein